MALSAKHAALLFIFTCGISALVDPEESLTSGGNRRELPPTCPTNCICSSHSINCEGWVSNTGAGAAAVDGEYFLPPPNTKSLSYDSLPNNSFDAFRALSHLDRLQWLSISNGELFNLPSFPPLPSLSYLDISNNKIQFLSSQAFNNTRHIIHLNISGNDLSNLSLDALAQLKDLKELDLSRNPSILQFPDNFFSPLRNLKFLDLSDTNIAVFQEQWANHLEHLHFLNLSYNSIESLPPISLVELEILDITNNPLLSLPKLAGFSYLKHLHVSHTSISYIKVSETEGCNRLQTLDLSFTNLTNLNEGVISQCKELIELNLSQNINLWRIEHGAFSNLTNLTVLHLNNCPNLYDLEEDVLKGLDSLRELYFQESGVKVLPYSLNELKNLTLLNLENTTLLCDCYSYWLPNLLTSSRHHDWKGVDVIHCNDGIYRTPEDITENLENLECSEVISYTESNQWVLVLWGKSALLECNVTGNPTPKIIWQTADQHLHVYNKSMSDHPWMHHQISEALSVAKANADGKFQVLQSGQLLIRDVTRDDIGRYKCFAFNPVSNSSIVAFLGLDDAEFRAFILESILFGFTCAVLFLLMTLLVQFIRYVMERLGLECCCCKSRLSPKAQQIKQLIESVESYKSAQLDKLRENYNSQVVYIKESCYQQMERVRDSYAHQSKNLKDLCDYSSQQFSGARDQYIDQVNKIRDYSMGQMNRVRENYVFQRHRIRKFSGHQLLRLRETYKYQQKTLNKLLETLPDLYIQNCRTGTCQRTSSIIFDNELTGLDVYYKVDFLETQSFNSDYYTPNSTLSRHPKQGISGHSRNASSTTSGGTEYHEAHSWISRQESGGSERSNNDQKQHIRSLSISNPPCTLIGFDVQREHRRSVSVSSHPSPHPFYPKSPLLEEIGDASSPTPSSGSSTPRVTTPVYTPLELTPVHEAKPLPKDDETAAAAVAAAAAAAAATPPSESERESSSLQSERKEDATEPIDNIKNEVQNKLTNCDKLSSESSKNCDTEASTIKQAHLKANMSYETSL